MTVDEFELLIIKGEGETIDFKREQYDLINSNDDNKAKFIKDIISFTNTIRNGSAFIIIGIESSESGKLFHGLNKHIDDAILQDQIKTRVYPVPQFSYDTIKYKELVYGIIEIPLKRYPEPISPIVKMKGLDPGKIYIRRGSSNSEAIGKEVLLIDRWIKNVKLDVDAKSEIDELLRELNSGQQKLSYYISVAYKISNHFQDESLINFCKGELSGWYAKNVELNVNSLPNHRKTTFMASVHQINNVTRYSGGHILIKNELKNDERFIEVKFVVQEPVTEIESTIDKDQGAGGYVTIKRNLADISEEASGSKTPVYLYADIEDYKNIYQRIKTELIRLLIRLRS